MALQILKKQNTQNLPKKKRVMTIFRYPTPGELWRLESWLDKHHILTKTGNHQNILWMYPANVAARRLARRYGVPTITNSDSHFRLQEVGLSRTAIPPRFSTTVQGMHSWHHCGARSQMNTKTNWFSNLGTRVPTHFSSS